MGTPTKGREIGVATGLSKSIVGSFVIGGIPAAITAQIMGGDPFQAFITGGTAAAFNAYLHKLDSPVDRRGGYVVGFTKNGEMIVRSITKEGNIFEYNVKPKTEKLSVKKITRTPDFYSINAGFPIGYGFALTPTINIDRYGQIFASPGIGFGLGGEGTGTSYTYNYLVQANNPTPSEMYNFLSEFGYTVGGGYLGNGFQYTGSPLNSGATSAYGHGYSTPGLGASVSYTPSFLIFNRKK